MRTIKKRAHRYAVAHTQGVSIMRAYVAGAMSERRQTKVFISGKISGVDYYTAYQTFANAERTLSSMGYSVVNPMHLCKKHWNWLHCMLVCLWHLLWCKKVFRLDNWRDSRGARIEYRVAKFLKKKFI